MAKFTARTALLCRMDFQPQSLLVEAVPGAFSDEGAR